MRYWVESSELWLAGEREVTWHGWPDGKPVSQAIGIPGSEDALVLLNSDAGPRTPYGDLKGWPNLVRVRPDGHVVWRVEAGTTEGDRDWWTAIEATSVGIWGTTWSCHRKEVDAGSGRILDSLFTK